MSGPHSRLNVFYLTLDKLQTFADGRYDVSAQAAASVEDNYVAQLSDAAEKLEALSIRKPAMPTGAFDTLAPLCRCVYSRVICSTAKLLQQNRSPSTSSGGSGSVLGGKGGGMASRAPSKGGLARSPSASATGPPPYSSGAGAASAAATSKRTPPPPPNKPKPGAASGKSYVVALYDYTATVSCRFLHVCLRLIVLIVLLGRW